MVSRRSLGTRWGTPLTAATVENDHRSTFDNAEATVDMVAISVHANLRDFCDGDLNSKYSALKHALFE
jgi:hypothetical protein